MSGSDQPAAEPRSASDRLDSWKEIAVYLKRDVRTVQRWEKLEALPVHRHTHRRQGSVFAFRAELDAWWLQRSLDQSTDQSTDQTIAPPDPPATPARTMQTEPAAPEAPAARSLKPPPAEVPAPEFLLPAVNRRAGSRQLVIGSCVILLGVALLAINLSRDHSSRQHLAEQHSSEAKAQVMAAPVATSKPSEQAPQIAARLPARDSNIPRLQKATRWAENLARVVVAFDKSSDRIFGDGVGIWRFSLRHPSSAAPIIASGGVDTGPQFSPDGRRIAFSSDRSGNREIWLADSDGSHLYQLTALQSALTSTPRWSPDGKWIAFDSTAHGAPEIFVVSSRGGEPRMVARAENREAVVPSWSKDGQSIYYSTEVNGEFEVMKSQLDGRAPEQITRRGGFSPQESTDGKFLYYAKKTQPGLWRMRTTGESEELLVLPDLPAGYWGYWALTAKGIYYVTPGENEMAVLRYYDLHTNTSHDLGGLMRSAVDGDPGLSVSKDGEWVLCAQRGNNVRLEASASMP